MIDHIYLPVSNIDRSLKFYEALPHAVKPRAPLGLQRPGRLAGPVRVRRWRPGFLAQEDHNNVPGALCGVHRDKQGSCGRRLHRSFGKRWRRQRAPGPRKLFGDRYYAANLLDPDRYSLEINFKPWLYEGPDLVSSRP
jgi:catechol 2,3-dioxygenase-like lactoylglutathione lyase family enzyme